MARKDRRRRDRRRKKEERRERIQRASLPARTEIRVPFGAPASTAKQKEEEAEISPKKVFFNFFIYGTMMLGGLLGGGIYIFNPSRYLNIPVTQNDWFVIGIGLGALISLIFGFIASRRVTKE